LIEFYEFLVEYEQRIVRNVYSETKKVFGCLWGLFIKTMGG